MLTLNPKEKLIKLYEKCLLTPNKEKFIRQSQRKRKYSYDHDQERKKISSRIICMF